MQWQGAAAALITAALAMKFASTLRSSFMLDSLGFVRLLQPGISMCQYSAALLAKVNQKWTALWTRSTLHPLVQLTHLAKYLNVELTVTDIEFDSVPVRVYVPKYLLSDGALVLFHGGGFVLFNVDSYDALARDLAAEAGMVTVSVNYRLAPEHLFPAAVEDCERAVVHFLRHAHRQYNVDPNKVGLIGDSAGGNLVAVVTQRLRRHTDLPIIKLIDFNTPSYCNAKYVYQETTLVDPESIARFMIIYLGLEEGLVSTIVNNNHSGHLYVEHQHRLRHLSHDLLPEMFKMKPCNDKATRQERRRNKKRNEKRSSKMLDQFMLDPNFSPIFADDLSDLPAALLISCEYDALRDEGYLYAKRLHDHGIKVAWWHLKAGFHGMFNMHRILPSARLMVNKIGHFVRSQLEQPESMNFTFPEAQFLP